MPTPQYQVSLGSQKIAVLPAAEVVAADVVVTDITDSQTRKIHNHMVMMERKKLGFITLRVRSKTLHQKKVVTLKKRIIQNHKRIVRNHQNKAALHAKRKRGLRLTDNHDGTSSRWGFLLLFLT